MTSTGRQPEEDGVSGANPVLDRRLKLAQRDAFGVQQRIDEGLILRTGHRAVQVVAILHLAPAVARGAEGHREVDALGFDDRRQRIVEVQVLLAGDLGQCRRQTGRGQRAAGDHSASLRDAGHLGADQADPPMPGQRFGDRLREDLAVNRQGAAGREGSLLCKARQQRPKPTQLRQEDAGGAIRSFDPRNSSRPLRPTDPSGGPPSDAPAASRTGRRRIRPRRFATPPRSPPGPLR
jgi:hypothetical protein